MERPLTKWFLKIQEAIVGDLIKNETGRIMDTKTSEIAERYWHSIPKIKSADSVCIYQNSKK